MAVPYPYMQGFLNETGSSCFMDSVLLAIFAPRILFSAVDANDDAFKKFQAGREAVGGDIVDGLLVNDFRSQSTACDEDPNTDRKLRTAIREALRTVYVQLTEGERTACTALRTLLGRQCRRDKARERDLSVNQQDVLELYTRLLASMGYSPMSFSNVKYFTNDEGQLYTATSSAVESIQHLVRLSNAGPSLLGSLTTESELGERDRYRDASGNLYNRIVERVEFNQAHVLVVHLVRTESGAFDARPVKVDHTVSLCVGGDAYQTYRLLSLVYRASTGRSVDSRHFSTMLVVPSQKAAGDELTYYRYDDSAREPFARVTRDAFDRVASTLGVLFFYFPYGASEGKCPADRNDDSTSAQETSSKRARNEDVLAQLVSFGYEEVFAQQALEATNGNLNEALAWLSNSGRVGDF